ncbi:Predicted outer membrane protein [Actinomyces viscosus]|uniref:Predicted outer membrane protein n=1 Tax=Actinomyces viscosus TaxID=1656 RepID=A0A448PN34_ACTVI|nr:CshA/CshB family fibrillar adhesin-related protein [Actinomyces viscosus]VEI17599.1 Predicted outer membrane protein [Actinomyces viscosus]
MLRRLFTRSDTTESTSARHALRRSRSHRRRGAAVCALALAGAALGSVTLPPPPAEAVHGDPAGGLGRFAPVIDWIDWTGMTGTRTESGVHILPDGTTGVAWSTPTQVSGDIWHTSRCTISNVVTTSVGRNEAGLTTRRGITVGYNTGTWRGDGLARLYNNGANYRNGVATGGSTQSNLLIGVGNLQDSSAQQFQMSCRSYLVTSSVRPDKSRLESIPNKVELPMEGMVFADAEASNWTNASKEHITVSPSPYDANRDVSYRLLETAQSAGCGTSSWGGLTTVSTPVGNRNGIKLRTDDSECSYQDESSYGPSSVIFISNTSNISVEVKGGGKSAVALGVVSYIDYGDAPGSYGTAGSVYQPSWNGGQLSGYGTLDISSQRGPAQAENGTWHNLSQAARQQRVASAGPAVVRLGELTDNDQSIVYSADASADDTTGTDDEDALPTSWDRVIWTDIGKQWSQQITCSGQDTKVAGWIDWNHDGAFTPTERSEVTTCTSQGTATLTWTVPQDAKRATLSGNQATTFMRLRITGPLANGQAAEDPQPTGIALNGEVEDHPVQVQLPNLTMTKTVDNTAAGALGLSPNDWTLSATPANGTAATGPGGFTSYQPEGDTVLSESSTSPKAAGYKPSIACTPHASSDLTEATSSFDDATSTLHLATGEWMHCTITNTAQAGQITWTKTDQDNNPLAGTVFTLAATSLTGGQVTVADCATDNGGGTTCPTDSPDQDPRPGYFKVTNLTWDQYTLTETQAPTGYQLSMVPITKTLDGSAPPVSATDTTPTLDLGHIVNNPIQGTATWTKTDETGHPLQGSQWSLTPLDANGHPVTDKTRTVTDCTTTCPQGSLDTNTRPGAFTLPGLTYGTYQLTETKAPAGYTLDATPRTIAITTHDQVIDLGAITNRRTTVPAIPLTGGSATTTYLIAGGAVLGITALVMAIQARKRRRALDS